MRPRNLPSEDLSPDPNWDALATLWFSEPGIELDIHTAASIGDVERVKYWISKGADLDKLNHGGWTPLMYAAYLGHEDVCHLLLLFSNGAANRLSIDARSRDRNQTALMLAASCGIENTVALLIKNGASLDAVDNKYHSALHYATDCNHAQIVRQLLVAGANPNLNHPPHAQLDDEYFTPFQLACNDGLDEIVHVYLQHGTANSKSVAEAAKNVADRNGHAKIAVMIDGFKEAGGKAFRKDQTRLRGRLLDGPKAVSMMMKLAANDSSPKSVKIAQPENKSSPGNVQVDQQKVMAAAVVNDYEKTLTVEQHERPKTIEELLELLQLSKYLDIFNEHEVSLEKLLTMDGEELKLIGITLFGPRKKLLNAIERWDQNVSLGIS